MADRAEGAPTGTPFIQNLVNSLTTSRKATALGDAKLRRLPASR